ncbi:putative glutamate receptor isoform X2 [Augochlora pura]
MQKQLRLSTSGSENLKNHGVIKQLLLLAVVCDLLTPVQSLRDVVWSKETQKFEFVANIPNFALLYNNRPNLSTANFHGRVFRFAYYDVPRVITVDETGTLSGYIGDIWTTLAEYLNFTLKPIVSKDKYVGGLTDNGEFTGLLRMLQLNQTDIVGRIESSYNRSLIAYNTFPLKKPSVYIYLKAVPKHITAWVLLLFSKKVWITILGTYILLSVCAYVFRTVETEIRRQNMRQSMLDYFFYSFSFVCSQNHDTGATSNSSRIIEYSIAIFALLLTASFNALVIGYLSRTGIDMPFDSITSLLEDTQYNIVTVKESVVHKALQASAIPSHSSKSLKQRYFTVDNITELYKTLCSKELVCAYLFDEETFVPKSYRCNLKPIGPVTHTDIISGIAKRYKDSNLINHGLLKLFESGIRSRILHKWHHNTVEDNTREPEGITLDQVYLVIMILLGGTF